MLLTGPKNWDEHVIHAEEVARGAGFGALRDRIIERAAPASGETCVDIGAGTGLLTLPLATADVKVWAVDISPAMCEYLRAKTASASLDDVHAIVGSAVSLPLVDECADVVVSNYCFHHLSDVEKRRALAEVHRVLRPGGRLVFGDMMFRLTLTRPRDRQVLRDKMRGLLRKGPAGAVRLAKNALRILARRWEQPADGQWWRDALREAGFADITVEELHHEGGLAYARKPARDTL
jgi:ubiquinone/menaquinone biosynthesis C-methylase UbiE